MSQLTEAAVEILSQAQAATLAQVLELQARWENLRDNPGRANSDYTAPDLHGRQKAYEAFRAARAEYTTRYQAVQIPETTPSTPERVAAWCRTMRTIVRRAGTEDCPTATVEKAHRMADRIAARLKTESVVRRPLGGLADAITALDGVIRWCEALVGSAERPEGSDRRGVAA